MTNLPIHPFTRLTAIGLRRDGSPIWPIMGGDGTAPAPGPATEPVTPTPALATEPTPATVSEEPTTAKPDVALGDAGRRALVAEREARAAAEAARKATERDASEARAAAEAARKATEKQVAELQKQIEAMQPAADVFAQIRRAAVPEAEKTDVERLTERLAAQEKAAADERLARLRLEVIQDKHLTKAHAEWLKGTTYEALAASADALLALFPKPAEAPTGDPAPDPPEPAKAKAATPKPDPSQGARGPAQNRAGSLSAAVAKAMSGSG